MKIKNYIDNIKSKYPTEKLFLVTKLETINENIEDNKIVDGYWVIGSIPHEPTVGLSMTILRYANSVNPEGKDGILRTSEIKEIQDLNPNGKLLVTTNSKYLIEEI